jgi:carboxymethylenebutenolidase
MGETKKLTASDGHRLDAYLARPDGTPKGGLVVIQEIFGVNSHIRAVADGFAAAGYLASAPAMFDRIETGLELSYDADGIATGRGYRSKISWAETAMDIAAARGDLESALPEQARAVGIVGYCWGGSLTWLGATEGGFAAAVGYYGGQIIELVDRTPRCPTLLHFGSRDAGIPLADVEKIRAAHPDVTIHVYEGAEHGFNCDQRASYNAAAAKLARERTLAFFAEHLKS